MLGIRDAIAGLHKTRLTFMVATLALTMAVAAAPVAAATPAHNEDGGRKFETRLTGAAEVPPGDPDGKGEAEVVLNQGQGRICFEIEVENLATVVAAHIHIGAANVAGPVVVSFDPVVNGFEGCVTADPDLIKAIRQNPSNYYVNVHTTEFPAGAVRGQLSK